MQSTTILRTLGPLALLAAACAGGDSEVREPVPTLFPDSPAGNLEAEDTQTSSTAATTTEPVADLLPPLARGVVGAVRADDGTARAITGTDGEVWFVVGACTERSAEPAVTAVLIGPQHVVLDPGAGGEDRGVEIEGLVEAELNLDIAERTADLLRADGVVVTLTREGDADLSTAARGAVAPATGAQALVSIHHAEPGSASTTTARPEVFHQIDDTQSRRLGGLLHEELALAFGQFDQEWAALVEPGVKPLLNQRGDDFFGVLQRSAGTPSVHVEVAALGPSERSLLATEQGRAAEAQALAEGLVRFLVTADQGSGFVDPAETVRAAPTSNTPGGCG